MPFGRAQLLSLTVLAVQSSTLTVLMRYARTRTAPMFFASSVVCVVEMVKLTLCLFLEYLGRNRSWSKVLYALWHDLSMHPHEISKMAIPAFLYAVQNNLGYLAISHLNAVTFQVMYQMKILTTALFSVLLLQKPLNAWHWAALGLLVLGVVSVQLANAPAGSPHSTSSSWIGFLVLLVNSSTSGFAGVYFERMAKRSAKDVSQRTLWMQSAELAVCGLFFSVLLAVWGTEWTGMRALGPFHGFDGVTWCIVLLQALGGITVAYVIKYADNILKAFATSVSIVLSSFVSYLFLEHRFQRGFVVGTGLVMAAVYVYARAGVGRTHAQKHKQKSSLLAYTRQSLSHTKVPS